MIPNFKKSELNIFGRIFFAIPFMVKYFEYKKDLGDGYSGYYAKGYRFRLIHPIAWIIAPTFYVVYFLLSMYDGGIKLFWRDIDQINDLFCLY